MVRDTGAQTRRTPDYLVIGHISKDLMDEPPGYAPGGTALYASLAAQYLGMQAAMVTACSDEDEQLLELPREAGVWVHRLPSGETTTFRNSYDAQGNRKQVLSGHAAPLRFEDVPEAWRLTPIVHLGPVAHELDAKLASRFKVPLLGVTPQGWLRSWDAEGHVAHSAWPMPHALTALPKSAFVVMSMEDLGNNPGTLHSYVNKLRYVAITQGSGEAYLCSDGECAMVPAVAADPVDPTGAGDVFAAALFVRYYETNNLEEAAHFAHAAAAEIIEGFGPSAVPDRRAVERRLANERRGFQP